MRSRAPPEPRRLQPQLPASCVSLSGPEVTGKQLDRQLGAGSPRLGAGARGSARAGGGAFGFALFQLCPPGSRPSPAAPAPAPGAQHAAPSGPRLARSPGRRRAGAAGQGTALLAPRASGAPARTPDARSRRAASSGPALRPGSRCTPFAARGEFGGVPLFATQRKAPFSLGRHPRTHRHPGTSRVAHLSPKSC